LSKLGRDGAALLHAVEETACSIRTHLLLVQRVRHLAHYAPNTNYHALWREYRLTWSSPLVLDVERMLELSTPFEATAPKPDKAELEAIRETIEGLASMVHGTNVRLRDELARAPHVVSRVDLAGC